MKEKGDIWKHQITIESAIHQVYVVVNGSID